MADVAYFPLSGLSLWILGVTLKGVLILLVAQAAAAALPRASAGLRHLLWSGGILGVLLIPALSLLLPWELPVVPLPDAVTVQADPGARILPPSPDAQGHVQGTPSHLTAQGTPSPASETAGGGALVWIFGLWAAGALLFLARLGLGALLLRRVVREAGTLPSSDWTRPLIEGADRLSVSRLPRLFTSDRVAMPVVSGVFDPAIVLPADAGEWTDRRRRAVLCHELAHIRRRDLLTNLLSRWACALYWFNPLVWIAARRLRAESERAADDLVLGVGTRPSEYADHLLQIVCGARRSRAPEVAIPMAQRREFEGRMLAILDEGASRAAPSRTHALGLAALALLLLLPVAAMAPAAPGPEGSRPGVTGAGEEGDGSLSPTMLAALLGGLEEAAPSRRLGAAEALGTLKARAGAGSLGRHLLRDPEPEVRLMAAWALGQIATSEALDPVTEAALRDGDESVRVLATWAMGRVADPAALSKLDLLLEDPSAEVRLRAAWAMGRIPTTQARGALVKALQDSGPGVSEMAAWALGQIRDPRTVPALTELAGDEFEISKPALEALWALASIGGDAVRDPLTRALERKNPDKKLADAIRLALVGEVIPPRPNDWPVTAAELRLKRPPPVPGDTLPRE